MKSNKGSSWERSVCKFLSKWIDGQDSKRILLWRGRGSGAMYTQSKGEIGVDFAGDIYSTSPESYFLTDNFSIECKAGYKDASLDKHLKSIKNDVIESFWKQCTGDAIKSNKLPMLIYKKTGFKTPWVGINQKTFDLVKEKISDMKYVSLNWNNGLEIVYFFEMFEFFNKIDCNFVKGIIWK